MDITNEEKAKQIAKKNSQSYGFGLGCDSSIECYNSALEAMQWKDEQYKKREESFKESIKKQE